MYADDGAFIEFTRAAASAQALVNVMFTALGAPLPPDNRTQMVPQGDFLGIVHDLSSVSQDQVVECSSLRALRDKAKAMLNSYRKDNRCTLAEASKFRGVQGFLNLSIFG